MSKHTWRDNAAEFATLDQGEGWPFARLIASSVEKGARPGKTSYRRDRDDNSKVGARDFAGLAQTSTDRVLRYLAAWDAAAKDGHCQPSKSLLPEDAPTTMEPDAKVWVTYYDSRPGARGDAIKKQAAHDGSGANKAVDIANNPKALATAIKGDPQTRRTAEKAIEEVRLAEARETIRQAGGNPDGTKAFEGDDITDWRARLTSIGVRIGNLRGEIDLAHREATRLNLDPALIAKMLNTPIEELLQAVYGSVPDTLAGLDA